VMVGSGSAMTAEARPRVRTWKMAFMVKMIRGNQ
jgi:hypothetical protein